jgi:hypothetical protein
MTAYKSELRIGKIIKSFVAVTILAASLLGRHDVMAAGAYSPATRPASFSSQPGESAPETIVFVSSPLGLVAELKGRNFVVSDYLTGLASPAGEWTDSNGNFYVADPGSGSVREYALNSSSPTMTYWKGVRDPVAVTTDKSDNVYVVDFNYGDDNAPSVVVEYPQGSNTPIRICKTFGAATGAVVDSLNNLWVVWDNHIHRSSENGYAKIEEFKPGERDGKNTGFKIPANILGHTAGVIADGGGNMLIADQDENKIWVVPAPYNGDGSGFLNVSVPMNPYGLALTYDQKELFITSPVQVGFGFVTIVDYPSGTVKAYLDSSDFAGPTGIALLPAPNL